MNPEIAYINLDTRPDRRQFMEKQLADLGLSAARLDATSPATTTIRPIVTDHPDMGVRPPMTPNEVACLESHSRVWRQAVDSDSELTLVLEDDVVLSPEVVEFLGRVETSTDWDLLRLETNFHSVRLGASEIIVGGRTARRLMQPQSGAGAYLLTRRAADRFLASPYFPAVPADTVIYAAPHVFELKVFQLIPAVATHLEQLEDRKQESAAQSEIEKTRGVALGALAGKANGTPQLFGKVRNAVKSTSSLLRWFSPMEVARSRRISVPLAAPPTRSD